MTRLQMNMRRRAVFAGGPGLIVLGVLVWGALPRGPVVITPPPAGAEPGRWTHLEGAANTRDAGGYPTHDGRFVKRGMIYRSGKLNRLTPAGDAAFRTLGVKTVLDFSNRMTPWPLFGGDGWGVQMAAAVHGCPMSFGKEGPEEEFYTRGVQDNAGAYRDAFTLLAEPERYPVLYHCAAGTDRTGVMSALLLTLLGVDCDTVRADFRLSEQVNRPGYPAALEALFKQVDAAGGIEAYLEGLGVTREVLDRIRGGLVEGPG